VAGRVAGAAEERRMAERQQAGVADQQVEGAGKQREAQHLEHEHRIGAEHRRQQGGQQQHAVDRELAAAVGVLQHYFSFPNRPAGAASARSP
jgi:hypothetical protein